MHRRSLVVQLQAEWMCWSRSQTVTFTNNCMQTEAGGHVKPVMRLRCTAERTGFRRVEVKLISGLRFLLCYVMTSSCHCCSSNPFTWKCSLCVGHRRRDCSLGFFFLSQHWSRSYFCSSAPDQHSACIVSYGCLGFTHLHKLPAPDLSLLGVCCLLMWIK